MILTITLNPALDLFAEVDTMTPGVVMRSATTGLAPGGKGINTARLLKSLGHEVVAAFLADRPGDDFSRLVAAEGLEIVAIPTGRRVRTNVHVEEKTTGAHYKINSAGGEMDQAVLDLARNTLEPVALKASAVILAGSLRPGLPVGAWARMGRMGKRHGALVAIDAEGQQLRSALDVPPDMVKINRREMASTFGLPMNSLQQTIATSRDLLSRGVGLVAITDHDAETCLVTRDGAWLASPPRIAAQRAVGAGDAFLAGLLHARLNRLAPPEMLRWGMACGTAVAHSTEHTRVGADAARELLKEVEVRSHEG